jgi:hypothetical protein
MVELRILRPAVSDWYSKPLPVPFVDPYIANPPAIQRIAEVFRNSLLKLEYSISSGGDLRARSRLNLLIAFCNRHPGFSRVTADNVCTWHVCDMVDYIATTAENILRACIAIAEIAVLLTVG